jgi:hypothetical protein
VQLEHDKGATRMRQDLLRTAAALQAKYEAKMGALREDLDLRRKAELHEMEERKNGQIHALMKQHEKAFGDIKNYYNDITCKTSCNGNGDVRFCNPASPSASCPAGKACRQSAILPNYYYCEP